MCIWQIFYTETLLYIAGLLTASNDARGSNEDDYDVEISVVRLRIIRQASLQEVTKYIY